MDGKASVIRAWGQRYVQQQGARGVVRTITATLDTALAEDARPWFHEHPVGALDVIILRRIAYNAMALFRARTLRADAHHRSPYLIRFTRAAEPIPASSSSPYARYDCVLLLGLGFTGCGISGSIQVSGGVRFPTT